MSMRIGSFSAATSAIWGKPKKTFYASDYSTLQAAINAAGTDACVIIDKDFTESVELLYPTNNGLHLWGVGEKAATLTADGTDPVIQCRAQDVAMSGFTVDGDGTATQGIIVGDDPAAGLNYRATNNCFRDIEIMNVNGPAVELQDYAFYEEFYNVRMMTGNDAGVHVNSKAGTAHDPGQTHFYGCEISGTDYCVKRTATAGTGHRYLFSGCGFYDGHSGDHMVDLALMHETTLVNCDFECVTNAPAQSMLNLGGFGQVVVGCFFSCKNYANVVCITGDSSYQPYQILGCEFANVPATGTLFSGARFPGGEASTLQSVDAGATRLASGATWGALGLRYYSSAAASPPTVTIDGYAVIWHDSTNDKEYLYVCSNGVNHKVELT